MTTLTAGLIDVFAETPLSGNPLAVVEGYIPGAYAFELSRIDETYQAEKWGTDAEAAKRATALAHELDKAVELIAAVR